MGDMFELGKVEQKAHEDIGALGILGVDIVITKEASSQNIQLKWHVNTV